MEIASSPIFVIGVPRSGTTLLTQILNASEQIYFGPESHFFEFKERQKRKNRQKLYTDYFDFTKNPSLTYLSFTHEEIFFLKNKCSNITSDREFLELLGTFSANKRGIRRWGEKTPGNDKHIDQIFDAFENAKVINIVRDPRAVYQSVVKIGKWDLIYPLKLKKRYKKNSQVLSSNETNPNFMSIKFEDLISNPNHIIMQICDFTGIIYSNKMIQNFAKDSNKNYNPEKEFWKNNSSNIDSSRSYAWQTEENTKVNGYISWLLTKEILSNNYPLTNSNSVFVNLYLFGKDFVMISYNFLIRNLRLFSKSYF